MVAVRSASAASLPPLPAGYPLSDPDTIYRADLLTAQRFKGEHPKAGDLTLVESFIRTATDIGSMNDFQIVEHYGEISRVLRHLRPLSADQVAERVIQLYRRHSAEVTGVMDAAFSAHASDIREEKLPATCAILLAIPESYKKSAAAEGSDSAVRAVSSSPTGGDGRPSPQADGKEAGRDLPHSLKMELATWVWTGERSEQAKRSAPKGDRWTGLHKQTQSG